MKMVVIEVISERKKKLRLIKVFQIFSKNKILDMWFNYDDKHNGTPEQRKQNFQVKEWQKTFNEWMNEWNWNVQVQNPKSNNNNNNRKKRYKKIQKERTNNNNNWKNTFFSNNRQPIINNENVCNRKKK